jgi:hypothetical protein
MTDEDPMDDTDPMADSDRCTATASSTGERCKQPAIPGGNVCRFHGGSAEQVQKKAQERLDEMADAATKEMQDRLADVFDRLDDADDDDYVKLLREARQLTTAILDRTGHGPSETREVTGEGGDPLQVVINDSIRED